MLDVMFWCWPLRVKEQGLLLYTWRCLTGRKSDGDIPIPPPAVPSIDHGAVQPQGTFL